MKIVIDIPEDRYLYMKGMYGSTWAEEFIAKGTPLEKVLEDIKAEIKEELKDFDTITTIHFEYIDKIIDNYISGKEKE